jgi:diguanylate cyclase (GGDEF)-like protein
MTTPPIQVLLVEDNSDYAWMLRLVLTEIYPDQFSLAQVGLLEEGLAHIRKGGCDVILLDLQLPDSSGFETFATMQALAPDTPIVVLTAIDDRELALRAVRAGAQDFLVKGDMDVIQLVRSTQYAIERHRNLNGLKQLALIDDLTGLLNRRGFNSLAEQQLKIAQRSNRSLILFFIDLDGLKQINDQYGHPQGDQALKTAAAVLRQTFRSSDIIARLSGDEFAALAIDAAEQSVPAILSRLRSKLAQQNQRGASYRLSLSTGGALFHPGDPADLPALLAEADRLLYQEKRKKQTQAGV